MHNILKKIHENKFLNQKESYQLFQLITAGKITNQELTSILISMKKRGESKEEIIGAINLFLKEMKYFPRPSYIFSDIAGTGGDIKNTINISTASAFVASACGFKIIKHCNKGISSKFGSSDLLKKFNINLDASETKSREVLDKLNICFLFAPKYHKGFEYVEKIRKNLQTKTIFNLLGPFLNPSMPPYTIIGVYHKKLINLTIEILKKLKYQRAIVLHGNDTDEVTLHGKTYVSELLDKKISSYILEPKDFGIKKHSEPIFVKNSSTENYHIIKKIMQGHGDKLHEELIAVNVAILLKIFGHLNLKENTQLALKKIRSGDVYRHIVNVANMLKEDAYARNNT